MLEGLCMQLTACPDLQVQACVQDGASALAAVRQWDPDCLVMELALQGRHGVDVIADMQAEGRRARPVLFTSAALKEVMRALDLGVQGLVSKQRSHHDLADSIRKVHAGQTALDQDLTVKTMALLLDRHKSRQQAVHALTPREVDVARMVVQGWPNKKIATHLSISEGTAKLHLHHIYQKLNCPGRMALMLYMQQHGLV
jgi:DNA-binding NarL/FixJ family response regulator